MLDESILRRILAALPALKIAVVGDLFLDKYLELNSRLTEPSIETGLDAYQVAHIRCYPGAGGTVLNNLRALGVGELHAISVIGIDGEGFDLLRALHRQQIHTGGVIQTDSRMTPTYTKPMLSQTGAPARELNRLDIKNRSEQSDELSRGVVEQLNSIVPNVHAVIVADQVTERNCGVVTDKVREHIGNLATQYPQTVFFADSRAHLSLFRNVIVKPNRDELCRTGITSAELCARTGRPVYVTQGSDGIVYVDRETTAHIPGIPVNGPIDIVGAGDSTTAGIVCGLCAGTTPVQAANLGCLVASITIQQIGVTGTATPAQVISRFNESTRSAATR